MVKYVATRDFMLGIGNHGGLTIKDGDELEVQGTKIFFKGEVYEIPSINACMNREWIVEKRLRSSKPKKRGPITKPPKEKDKRVINISIPRKWATMHWVSKLNFIKSCYNVGVLEKLRDGESDKMNFHIDNQIKQIRANPATAKDPAKYTLQKFPDNEDVPLTGMKLD